MAAPAAAGPGGANPNLVAGITTIGDASFSGDAAHAMLQYLAQGAGIDTEGGCFPYCR